MAYQTHENRIEPREELKTRELARELAAEFRSLAHSKVSYNLSNVSIMSRSFADEFHKQKMALAQDGIIVEVSQARDDVFRMLQHVAATQDRPVRPATNLEPIHIRTVEQAWQLLAV